MDSLNKSFNRMKVQELRDECEKMGLDTSGTKPILVQRIKDHISSNDPNMPADGFEKSLYDETRNTEGFNASPNEHFQNDDYDSEDIVEENDDYCHENSGESEAECYDEAVNDDEKKASDSNIWWQHEKESDFDLKEDSGQKENFRQEYHEEEISRASSDNESHETQKNANELENQLQPKEKEIEGNTKEEKRKPKKLVKPPIDVDTEEYENTIVDVCNDIVQIDGYNSDLHFMFTNSNGLQGCNMTKNQLCHFWCSVKSNIGIKKGCKVFYECKYIKNLDVRLPLREIPEFALRVGFSTTKVSHLGDSKTSVGVENNGKIYNESSSKVLNLARFTINDAIGVYLDTTSDVAIFFYTVNGNKVPNSEVKIDLSSYSNDENNQLVFYPHIYFKNIEFSVEFQSCAPVDEHADFMPLDSFSTKKFFVENFRPLEKANCRVYMVCGSVASGKTTWVKSFVDKQDTPYTIIGRSDLWDRWRVLDQTRKVKLSEKVVTRALAKHLEIAAKKNRCYILDQTNCYASTRKKRLELFKDFPSIVAVVIVPRLSEYEKRIQKLRKDQFKIEIDDRSINDYDIADLKKSFVLPTLAEGFHDINYVESTEEETKNLLVDYRHDAERLLEITHLRRAKEKLLDRIKVLLKKGSHNHKPRNEEPRRCSSRSNAKARPTAAPKDTDYSKKRISPAPANSRFHNSRSSGVLPPPTASYSHNVSDSRIRVDSRKRLHSPNSRQRGGYRENGPISSGGRGDRFIKGDSYGHEVYDSRSNRQAPTLGGGMQQGYENRSANYEVSSRYSAHVGSMSGSRYDPSFNERPSNYKGMSQRDSRHMSNSGRFESTHNRSTAFNTYESRNSRPRGGYGGFVDKFSNPSSSNPPNNRSSYQRGRY